MPWRTMDGSKIVARGKREFDTLLRGIFDRKRFVDLLRHFIVFEVDGDNMTKSRSFAEMLEKTSTSARCADI